MVKIKMYLAEKLHNNVFYYKDVVSDHKNFIKLLEDYDRNELIYPVIPKWGRWNSSSNDEATFGNKKDFNMSKLDLIDNSLKNDANYFIDTLKNAIHNVAKSFIKDRNLEIEPNISPFVGVSKWNPGCMLGVHFDRLAGDKTLLWTIVIYLNDDYEGGEISFIIRDIDFTKSENSKYRPHDDMEIAKETKLIDFWLKPEAGSALVFPSNFPYMHQVHLMKSGSKYICQSHIFIDGYDPNNEEHRKKYNAAGAYND